MRYLHTRIVSPRGTECATREQGVAITINRCDGSITVLVNKLFTHSIAATHKRKLNFATEPEYVNTEPCIVVCSTVKHALHVYTSQSK
jgi:hypothetical protein